MVKKTIVWADDHPEVHNGIARQLKTYLLSRGIDAHIEPARDGNEVFRLRDELEKSRVDLYILDLNMPSWNGVATVQSLARLSACRMVVVSSELSSHQKELNDFLERRIILGAFDANRTDWFGSIYSLLYSEPPRILHFSDLHFGKFHAYNGSVSLIQVLEESMRQMVESERPNLIVISGDLTSTGHSDEFDRVREFVDWLQEFTGLPISRFVFVPGNHDLYRNAAEQYRFSAYIDFLNQVSAEKGAEGGKLSRNSDFLRRYERLFDESTPHLRWGGKHSRRENILTLGVFDDLNLMVVGLTSVVDDEKDFGRAEVPQSQLVDVRNFVSRHAKRVGPYLKLAVMHHHLVQVPAIREGNEDLAISNQGLVLKELVQHGFQMVMHGHTHYPAAFQFRPYFLHDVSQPAPITVISSGTLAGEHVHEARPSFHFSIVKVELEGERPVRLVIKPYSQGLDTLTWRKDPEITCPI